MRKTGIVYQSKKGGVLTDLTAGATKTIKGVQYVELTDGEGIKMNVPISEVPNRVVKDSDVQLHSAGSDADVAILKACGLWEEPAEASGAE